ncbi:hypothetical protein ACIQFZ_43530 [Streptomyces sp. NPDC093064]|uniref:hypothetical protein n=1 Tax=Streptomyces sp. NPDC093064 TaxID=3366020 RepID=UPI003826CE78
MATVERDDERLVPMRGPEGEGGLTMYLAAEGKPYIRFMEGTSQSSEMKIEFSRYGEPVGATVPPPGKVLNATGDGSLFDI